MKRLVPLLLVACSTRSAPAIAMAPANSAREPALVAGHGASIELLAVSDDGRAAVSQDANGGTRLWPTLDGTREPFVVAVARATTLALGRSGSGFVIAARDEGGGAEIVRVEADGSVTSCARIAPDPAIDAIAIAPQGVLAIRDDQTVAIYTTSGERTARLEAAPGTRLVAVATRNGHTLVIASRDHTLHGRWLDGTSWGTTTPDFRSDLGRSINEGGRVALSPNGRQLLIDVAAGALRLDIETGKLVDQDAGTTALGFPDDESVVSVSGGNLVWRRLNGSLGGDRSRSVATGTPLAVADDIVVGVNGESLVLHTREQAQQLGYAIRDIAGIQVVGDRVVVIGDDRAVVLDRSLAQRGMFALPVDTRTLGEVLPIDERFVIATHTLQPGTWWVMSVNDLVRNETTEAMPHPLQSAGIRYQPATGLLAISDRAASYLAQWDSAKRSFETWYTLAGGAADVHLLDPARNEGLAAIALRPKDGAKVEIAEIAREQLVVGAPIQPLRSYTVDGHGIGVDEAGTVYVNERGMFVGYKHGVEAVRIADGRDTRFAVHPRGTYIAMLAEQTIRLYDASGALHWQIAAPLAQRITWLGDDLLVDYAGGLGKIDAATGALNKRACGWSFGLSALSGNVPPLGDSICDAQ